MISVALVISAIPMLVPSVSPVGSSSAQGGYVQVGWMQKFQNWNPLNIELVSDWVATFLIYSTLFQYDEDLLDIEDNLALDYYQRTHVTGNMSTYINITHSAYFRNGVAPDDTSHPLTAEDVKYTIELIQDNPGGVWDYYVANVTGVYVLSPYQVQIDTAYPKATLIDDLVWVPILPKYWWSDPANVDPKKVLFNMNPNDLIGSSAFYFDEMQLNQWYKFTTAPNYHCTADFGDARDIDIDGIIYTIYSNIDGLRLAIESGAEDVVDITGAQTQTWDGLGVGKPNIIKQVTTELGIYDVCINAIPLEFRTDQYCDGNVILLDRVVRKALGMTMNRDSLVHDYFNDRAVAADTVLNPGFWHADLASQTEVLPFNPQWAKDNLTSAGYADTNGDDILEVTASTDAYKLYGAEIGAPLEFRLRVPDSDPGYTTVGEAWVDWARQAGIDLNFEIVAEGIMISFDWYKAYFDVWVWSWYWGPEPLSNLAVWRTTEVKTGGDNCAGPICDDWYWIDEENRIAKCSFDEVLEEAMRTVDVNERKALVDELQVMIYDSYTEFPPIHPNGLYAMSTTDYVGWGDWAQHLGRTIISDMLWIWYDITPAGGNTNPVFDTPLNNAYEVEVDQPAYFTIGISDEDGDPITVTWSWGDGSANLTEVVSGDTTVEQMLTRSHTYTALEEYTLVVSIVDDEHTTGNAEIALVNVVGETNLGPEIGTVTAVPSIAYENEEVTWTATARDAEQGPTGEGLLFTWDWGDGSPNSIQLVKPVTNNTYVSSVQTHTWSDADEYTVVVSVWDGFDEDTNSFHNVTTQKSFEVIANSVPTGPAVSAINGIEGVAIPCIATAYDPDPDVLTFTWEWDDGTYSVTTHDTSGMPGVPVMSVVSHTWSADGTYPVTVYVDDGEGVDHNVSAAVSAEILTSSDDAPPGSISMTVRPYPPYVNEEVTLNISAYDANGDALTVTIEFGDGDFDVATTAGGTTDLQYVEFTHTYTAADTYDVMVYVDDGTSNESAPFELVISLPIANRAPVIVLQSSYSFYLGVEKDIRPVEVYDPDDDTITVWYDWGDESPLTKGDADDGYAAVHTYVEDGDYDLTVRADDGEGHNSTAYSTVNVQEENRRPRPGPIVKDPLKSSYEINETIAFNFVVADKEGDVVKIIVDFGDGANQTLNITDLAPETNRSVSVTHAYGEAGQYKVIVTIMDDYLHSDVWLTSETNVEVKAEDEKGGLSSTDIMIIALAIIIVVVIALVLLMRRKKGPSEEGGMEGMAPPETPEQGPPPPP